MRFQVHQSHRLEDLLALMANRLASDPLPPLQCETILVPAQGLARWVQLRLAERFGIAAGIRMPFVGAFLQELCRSASPTGHDPFARDVLVWRLWRLLGSTLLREELGAAAKYCDDDPDGSKRLQLCTRLAACFDDYQLYRDDVLLAFARGDDGKGLGPHAAWQACLWRALLRDAGAPAEAPERPRRARPPETPAPWLFPDLATAKTPRPEPGTAHRLEQLRHLLQDPQRARAALPPRLSVFGSGTLPPAFVRLLQAIAMHVPVDIYIPQPTAHFFGDLRARGDTTGGNALLAQLGTEAREFADLLQDLEGSDQGSAPLQRIESEVAPDLDAGNDDRATLLHCLQQDIVHVRERGGHGGPERLRLLPTDDTLRVHDCHSPQRELEVVRDQILAAFADDASLRPHDVLVLVPDIDRYAPYAHAVFSPVADHLPFHVADRSPARELPICKALLEVLQLATSRLHTFDVLHLLEEPAVRRRFGLFATDLPMLRRLCEQAGIRWGIDGPSRHAQFGLPAFDDNSWRHGIERLLLGAATGPIDDLMAGILPVGHTTESRLPLLERFVGFLDTLFARLEPLRQDHPLLAWAAQIDGLVGEFFAPDGSDDDTALAQLRKATVELRRLAVTARHTDAVSPVVMRDWLVAALQQSTGSRGFLAGSVTVAAMLPMRTVPVRCLFVCGLDDVSFPRRDRPVPFDLIAAVRRPGDRSRRLDDRQMFLDVLLAARDRLHLTFVGHSAKDDSPCAPSVVLSELLEHVDRSCLPPQGSARARDFVVVRQPLQPWSRRYRSGDDARLFTFTAKSDPPATAMAAEMAWCRDHALPAAPPPTGGIEVIPLDRLLEFWRHPCRFFLVHTMRLRLRRNDDRDEDNESFELDNLAKYHLQDEALQRALRGEPPRQDPFAHARATGVLPVGAHGTAAFGQVTAETERFLHEALRDHGNGLATVEARGKDFLITGEVDGIGAQELVCIRTARLKPKDKLRSWILHLVLATARHQGASNLPARTRVVGTDESRRIEPFTAELAAEHLEHLVLGYRRGHLAPLPFFEDSSHAYGEALDDRKSAGEAARAARQEWEQPAYAEPRGPRDSVDPHIQLCMRGRAPLDEAGFTDLATLIWQTAASSLGKVGSDAK